MNKIITIGREFGSGGRELGRRLAETLGFQYYDKEIISEIAKKTDLSEEYISQIIEQRPNRLLPITIGHSINIADTYQLNQMQKIYEAQCDLLRTLAEKSNCVIVGRCADYLLKDYNPFRIFVYANIESRVNRCFIRENKTDNYDKKQLKKKIIKIDKERSKYYEFITGNRWGFKENYDLCINTTDQNIKEIVAGIAKIFG
jgi:cytidylate kinase